MADIAFSTVTTPTFRAYNRCKFDIGVKTAQGREYNIKPDSFALLTMDDIAFIDSVCQKKKLFGSGMLEAVDANGKPISTAALKKSLKAFTEWLNGIDDPVELHAIYTVASGMDLPASKLKVLNAKMPNKDWLDELN